MFFPHAEPAFLFLLFTSYSPSLMNKFCHNHCWQYFYCMKTAKPISMPTSERSLVLLLTTDSHQQQKNYNALYEETEKAIEVRSRRSFLLQSVFNSWSLQSHLGISCVFKCNSRFLLIDFTGFLCYKIDFFRLNLRKKESNFVWWIKSVFTPVDMWTTLTFFFLLSACSFFQFSSTFQVPTLNQNGFVLLAR